MDRFIALSAFARDVFVQGGLPPDRLAVKANTLPHDPGPGVGGDAVLFAGRLTEEKGVRLLLEAWAGDPLLPALRIAGDGPLGALVEAAAAADARVEWLGWQEADAMAFEMSKAAMLVVPSTWYEGWPLSAVEAMGYGTPVVATDHGPFPEMIEDGVTGRLFARSDADALAEAVHGLMDTGGRDLTRARTRQRFQERYARDVNYGQLRAIYRAAMAQFTAA